MIVLLIVMVPLVLATATFDLVVEGTEKVMKKAGHALIAKFHRHKAPEAVK